MPTYVSLVNWTEQGVKNFRDTVRRGEDVRGLVEKNGGQLRLLLWTLGEYDLVSVIDFPDDETATAVLLQVAAGGNVRTKTMKAFDAEPMGASVPRPGERPPPADPDPGSTDLRWNHRDGQSMLADWSSPLW
jgi:uncharacterized protein with GYD domain